MLDDRYVATGEPLTDREREVLMVLQEECAEVIHAASKILRFGKNDRKPGREVLNMTALSLEIGDVLAMVTLCQDCKLVDETAVRDGMARKVERLKKYLQSET